jgi:hypothetical protein
MTNLSNATAPITTNIAPAHPAGQGKSQPGGHIRAWRMQPAFALEAKLNVIGANLWRPGTRAHEFYEKVLAKAPGTVGECIEMAKSLSEPFTEKQIQGHLRWAFTASGAFLEIDGQRYSAPPSSVKAVKASAKKTKLAKPVEAPKVAVKAAVKKVAVKKSKIVEAA